MIGRLQHPSAGKISKGLKVNPSISSEKKFKKGFQKCHF
jgi:hypothetical protein